ncbi:MAG: M14 family metallopeptidase [Pseudomonadota bacterium]
MADLSVAAAPPILDRIDYLPDGLWQAEPRDTCTIFPNPTLIELTGERPAPLCLTTLLHGNETTSFFVLRALAERYRDRPLPRSLTIFVGNVRAMAAGVRFLPDQPDFNRIWAEGDTPYHRLVHEVADIARAQGPFASIDIHNNSGTNPHYGCVNALRPADLHLAAMFASIGVYYRNPPTTQSIAFSSFCPAVTVECGRSGDEAGIARAVDLVERTMRLDSFPDTPPPDDAMSLYHTLGAVLIDPDCDFAFGGETSQLSLRPDLETLNFTDLPADTQWATVRDPVSPLRVVDEHGGDITAQFFVRDGDTIRLRRPATPAMVTQDRNVIRQDCLCYLMEPL